MNRFKIHAPNGGDMGYTMRTKCGRALFKFQVARKGYEGSVDCGTCKKAKR